MRELLILPVCQGTSLAKADRILVLAILVVTLIYFNDWNLYLLVFISLPVSRDPSFLGFTPIHSQRGRPLAYR